MIVRHGSESFRVTTLIYVFLGFYSNSEKHRPAISSITDTVQRCIHSRLTEYKYL